MKTKKYIITIAAMLSMGLSSCTDWLDQEPMSNVTTGAYYNTAAQFTASANYLIEQLQGWSGTFTSNEMWTLIFDQGSDLSAGGSDEGNGTKYVPTSDTYYTKFYKCLRHVNNLLEQAEAYNGTDNIDNSIGTAYFCRAWWHFMLLKRFGGVALMTSVPNTESEVVWGPRNSRYEVVASILSDLDKAENLVSATKSSTSNDGHLTIEAVCAFKARVCLFEGTWEKYNGRGPADTTNGDGSSSGAGTTIPSDYPSVESLLTMAKTEAAKFVSGGQYSNEYSLFMGCEDNSIDDYKNMSYNYLFLLESSTSNPNGCTKDDNNEAIFRRCYDYSLQKYSNVNLAHSSPCGVSRKMVDMFLCTDGLPINKSPLFKGYQGFDTEFQNRDARMAAMVKQPCHYYWCGNNEHGKPANWSIAPASDPNNANGCAVPDLLTIGGGYGGRKFVGEEERSEYQCAFDYLHIRLPEMLLTYAEATYELNGSISDTELNNTINVIRKRAHIANLTNSLVSSNGLNMLEEIRRERAIELFGEGFRINDLCRWGIAEKELARPICSFYVSYNGTPTDIATSANPVNPSKMIYDASIYAGYILTEEQAQSTYTAGMPTVKPGAIITTKSTDRIFSKRDYLQPIPTNEIALNHELNQNPLW